jgi:hypothetical protein
MDIELGPLYEFIWHTIDGERVPGYIVFIDKVNKIIFNPPNKFDHHIPRVVVMERSPSTELLGLTYVGYDPKLIHQMFEVIFKNGLR